jgi:hypothetical protein
METTAVLLAFAFQEIKVFKRANPRRPRGRKKNLTNELMDFSECDGQSGHCRGCVARC